MLNGALNPSMCTRIRVYCKPNRHKAKKRGNDWDRRVTGWVEGEGGRERQVHEPFRPTGAQLQPRIVIFIITIMAWWSSMRPVSSGRYRFAREKNKIQFICDCTAILWSIIGRFLTSSESSYRSTRRRPIWQTLMRAQPHEKREREGERKKTII